MRWPPYNSTHIAAGVAVWSVATTAFAVIVSMLFIPVGESVPSYAMESVFVFRLEHAIVISALLILPALVVGPSLAGVLPQRLSTDGIEWGHDRANVVESLGDIDARLDKLEDALAVIAEINRG